MSQDISALCQEIQAKNDLKAQSDAAFKKLEERGKCLSEAWWSVTQQAHDRDYHNDLLDWISLDEHVLRPHEDKKDKQRIKIWAKLFVKLGKLLVDSNLDQRLTQLCHPKVAAKSPEIRESIVTTLEKACKGDLKGVESLLFVVVDDWQRLYVPFREMLWQFKDYSNQYYLNNVIRPTQEARKQEIELQEYFAQTAHEKQIDYQALIKEKKQQNCLSWIEAGWEAVRRHHISEKDQLGFNTIYYFRFESDGYLPEVTSLPNSEPQRTAALDHFFLGWADNWIRLFGWIKQDKELFDKAINHLPRERQDEELWVLGVVCNYAIRGDREALGKILWRLWDSTWPRYKKFLDAMDRFAEVIGTQQVKVIAAKKAASERETNERSQVNAQIGKPITVATQEPELNNREISCLDELLNLGAVSMATRKPIRVVASKVSKNEPSENFKRTFSKLKRCGYTCSVPGYNGGVFLSPAGNKRAEMLKSVVQQ